jgi:uncharacterized membrane protein YqhA
VTADTAVATLNAQLSVLWQVAVHLTSVASALLLAWTDRISSAAVETPRARGLPGSLSDFKRG